MFSGLLNGRSSVQTVRGVVCGRQCLQVARVGFRDGTRSGMCFGVVSLMFLLQSLCSIIPWLSLVFEPSWSCALLGSGFWFRFLFARRHWYLTVFFTWLSENPPFVLRGGMRGCMWSFVCLRSFDYSMWRCIWCLPCIPVLELWYCFFDKKSIFVTVGTYSSPFKAALFSIRVFLSWQLILYC